MIAVSYERWSVTTASKYSNLTRKRLVFWKSGHLWKAVVHEMVAAGGWTVALFALRTEFQDFSNRQETDQERLL